MPISPTVPFTRMAYSVTMTDASTPSSAFVTFDRSGVVDSVYGVAGGVTSGSDNAITFKLNHGSAISGFTATVVTASAAIGDKITATVPKSVAVVAGDSLEIVSDGAGGGTVPVAWVVSLATTRSV
jgi:hypothetical protein